MYLLWMRGAASTGIDRDFLAALPDATIRCVRELGELSRALATDKVDAVFASGHWSTTALIQAYQEAQERGNPAMLVLLPPGEASGEGGGPHAPQEQLERAVALAQAGIHRVLTPDISVAALAAEIREASCAAALARQTGENPESSREWARGLVGSSRAMNSVIQTIELVSQRRCTVLITGETGTGKEMVARALHAAGPRSRHPWVPVNCTALPDTLLEAELFGHTKGAFTGAVSHRVGRFEEANHGTIFLDEIGDMPLDLQAKLLRVLQEREVQRIGSSETIPVDVRVVAATNVNLQEKVAEGKFREDLYYRLNVVPITIPPLRERTSDIPLLTQAFIEKICRLEGLAPKKILQEAMHHLCTYDWPGNVRQLENTVEMALVLSGDRQVLVPSDFRLPRRNSSRSTLEASPAGTALELPEDGLDFEATVSALERALLRQALERTRGNKRMAAELLRLKRTTLTAKIKSLEMAS
jgi:DNA-binding NtrC family response regulator